MIYHTSDWHCFHENIIKLCHRPYNNVLDMNDSIINTTNDLVREEDLLINHGDLIGGRYEIDQYLEYTKSILDKLKCKNILLVGGNHDLVWLKKHGLFVKNKPYWNLFKWQKQCIECDLIYHSRNKCGFCGYDKFEFVDGIFPMGLELRLTPKLCNDWKVPVDVVKNLLVVCTHYSLRVFNKSHYEGQSINLFGHSHGNLMGGKNSLDVGWDVWKRPISILDIVTKFIPEHNNKIS